jgi:four helix bundle protein
MKTYSFETLDAWQKARNLAIFTYEMTRDFPKEEQYGLVSQMRRASVSICSNLAEGNSKFSGKEKARYTETSYCSLMELLNQVLITAELSYVTPDKVIQFRNHVDIVSLLLTELRKAQLQM